MAEEEKLLMRLKNRKRNAIDEAIEVYTPYLSTVLYNMLGNRLPKEDEGGYRGNPIRCVCNALEERRYH